MTGEDRSLEQIEGVSWGDPPDDATYLIRTVHRLRRTPIGELGVEGLRMLINQRVGLPVLVPLALDELERNPAAEGDFHPGDLLAAVRRVPDDYWAAHPEEAARLAAVT